MAKKSGEPSKSDAIREVLQKQPKLKSREVVAMLAEKGIKVTPTLVYLIKSKNKRQVKLARRVRAAEVSRTTGSADPVKLIIAVRQLAKVAGGIREFKKLVDVLAE